MKNKDLDDKIRDHFGTPGKNWAIGSPSRDYVLNWDPLEDLTPSQIRKIRKAIKRGESPIGFGPYVQIVRGGLPE